MNRNTKEQQLFKGLKESSNNTAKLSGTEAMKLYKMRLERFSNYMFWLSLQGKLFVKDYKGNLRCVNAEIEEAENG